MKQATPKTRISAYARKRPVWNERTSVPSERVDVHGLAHRAVDDVRIEELAEETAQALRGAHEERIESASK